MPSPQQPVDTFAVPPDPGRARTLDELVERLRSLKVWAGDPSYECIKDRVNASWTAAGLPASELVGRTTVLDCFRSGRRRLNTELVLAIVHVLHPDSGYVAHWQQALRVIGGQSRASAHVQTQDRLPPELAGFTGRNAELDQLRQVLRRGLQLGGAGPIAAVTGMAGVGKTALAVHAGRLLVREEPLERVLFVNLRGFHPDPGRPPVDPAAVLDGFLRLLGVPGHQIPHDLSARAAAYRRRLAGTPTLVLLDNAADTEQVRPLLPDTPGCPVLITSRRDLGALNPATHITLDVFSVDEAVRFLAGATPLAPLGPDPNARARIAHRCGYLPLALGLVTGHIRGNPGWTLTDQADRLDERHHHRHVDTGVQLALDLSYQQLPSDQQRLLRLAALHPGQDLDTHAAAALTGSDLATAQALTHDLCGNHLLQPAAPGRYTLHDLVRAYAAARASDEDPPPQRRAALTRLFDYYLGTAAAAMDSLYPAEVHRRPRVLPPGTPMPALPDLDAAYAWLDTERPNLVAVAAHAATHDWPTHTIRLSATLFRYLVGGHFTDALTIHGHARDVAVHTTDSTGPAEALTNLGVTYMLLGRYEPAAEHIRQALHLYQLAGDLPGRARALASLGSVEERLGHYGSAAEYYERALPLYRQAGDRTNEARTLGNLGVIEARRGRYQSAADHYEQELTLYRQSGDLAGEAESLSALGHVEVLLDRPAPAADHLQQALTLHRRLGNRTGESWTLDKLGILQLHLGRPAPAAEHFQQALAIFREIGDRQGDAWALNGLGEAARAGGHTADAMTHHTAARTIAAETGDRDQQARAHTGLGHAHHTLADPVQARQHYQQALTLYTELGMPQADQIRAHLTTIDEQL